MFQPEDEFAAMTHSELRAYLKRLELNVGQVRRRLRQFEATFGASTEDTFARLQPEEIAANTVLSEWAGEREMLQRLEAQRTALADRLR
jgi:hypothetical protein